MCLLIGDQDKKAVLYITEKFVDSAEMYLYMINTVFLQEPGIL